MRLLALYVHLAWLGLSLQDGTGDQYYQPAAVSAYLLHVQCQYQHAQMLHATDCILTVWPVTLHLLGF